MNLISIENYEIGNGIEAVVEEGKEEYRVYLQLPETADSEHAFLDGTEDEDFMEKIVGFIESKYSQDDVIISSPENDKKFKISPYSNYYRVELWEEYDENKQM